REIIETIFDTTHFKLTEKGMSKWKNVLAAATGGHKLPIALELINFHALMVITDRAF
ncbi:hypothetical protein RYX36_008128, partial [Vicia faba]